MKRSIIVLLAASFAVFGMVGMSGTSLASNGSTLSGSFHSGPFTGSSPDSGTCGNNWAMDLYVRNFTATANLDGTFNVTEKFSKGHFSTLAGQSPGACDTNPGGTLTEGISGSFKGSESGIVTNGTFNQSGSCERDADGLCTTLGWIHGFFGDSADFTVTPFHFVYKSSDPSLDMHSWTNANTGNIGDIASS